MCVGMPEATPRLAQLCASRGKEEEEGEEKEGEEEEKEKEGEEEEEREEEEENDEKENDDDHDDDHAAGEDTFSDFYLRTGLREEECEEAGIGSRRGVETREANDADRFYPP